MLNCVPYEHTVSSRGIMSFPLWEITNTKVIGIAKNKAF